MTNTFATTTGKDLSSGTQEYKDYMITKEAISSAATPQNGASIDVSVTDYTNDSATGGFWVYVPASEAGTNLIVDWLGGNTETIPIEPLWSGGYIDNGKFSKVYSSSTAGNLRVRW
jgi:hypothetical protein